MAKKNGGGGPLTKEEFEKFDRLLKDDVRFEKMVDRAVRGMRRLFRGKD